MGKEVLLKQKERINLTVQEMRKNVCKSEKGKKISSKPKMNRIISSRSKIKVDLQSL